MDSEDRSLMRPDDDPEESGGATSAAGNGDCRPGHESEGETDEGNEALHESQLDVAAGNGSRIRQATLEVADAIDASLEQAHERHHRLSSSVQELRDRHVELTDRQEQLIKRQVELVGKQIEMAGRQDQIAETVGTILSNQKTSGRCYHELMATLTGIKDGQVEDTRQLVEMANDLQRQLKGLRTLAVASSVVLAVLVIAGVVVCMVM